MKNRKQKYTVFGKDVDIDSLELVDINHMEWPQFESAGISLGFFTDGSEMGCLEIQEFIDLHNVTFYEEIINSL
tara:strand:+ start:405 stop:626 length:222 start_codon:yes stop_codon:yes gene_type:complete